MGITGTTRVGDMLKSTYDTNKDNVVDKAEAPRSGTEFPVDVEEGDVFYRTDEDRLYIAIET